jgi:hypothetical protein
MESRPFSSIVHDALSVTTICTRLESGTAVMLERVPRSGGATNWCYCASKSAVADVESRLLPGSVVTFYFDGRIRADGYSAKIKSALERIVVDTGELLIGQLKHDGLTIDVEVISGPIELNEYLAAIGADSQLFYGVFPARDNDGIAAVTVTLPDHDGIVRPHPH